MLSWIERRCRLQCGVRAVGLGVLTLILLCATIGIGSCAAGALRGPYPVTADEIRKAPSASAFEHDFVVTDCTGALDTGVVYEKGSKRTTYWAVPAGDKWFLVSSERRPAGPTAGVIKRIDSEVQRLLDPELRKQLLPFCISDEDPRWPLVIGFFFVAAVTGFVGFHAVRAVRWAIEPSTHPAVAKLATLGGLDAVSHAIEAELSSPKSVRFRGWVFGRRFAIDTRIGRFEVRAWTDLLWAYKVVTRHRIWFVIPSGSTYDAVFHFDGAAEVRPIASWTWGRSAAESRVDDILALATDRAPWAVIGYSDAVAHQFRSSLPSFRAAVAARRPGAQSPPPLPPDDADADAPT